MRGSRTFKYIVALAVLVASASAANAGQIRSTTGRGSGAVASVGGFTLRPVGTAPRLQGDLAPVQLFEIVRPSNQRITIGRLFTSCTCVILEADKTTFEAGEPAILRLRNTLPTPPDGQMYAVYVQLSSPIRNVLRHDTFVRSSQFVPASAEEEPTRGNIEADGILSGDFADGDIEIIVPKADNYIADTSEYTLRKQAQEEAALKGGLPETTPDFNEEGEEIAEEEIVEDEAPLAEAVDDEEPIISEVISEEFTDEVERDEANAEDFTTAITEEIASEEPEAVIETVVEDEEVTEDPIAEIVDDETVLPEETTESAVEELDVVEQPVQKSRVSPRVAARKQAMQNSMRAAEEMTNKANTEQNAASVDSK